ncbi:MAG: hypothetical protein WCO56_11560 [Verrucomicrobiota bacterium]
MNLSDAQKQQVKAWLADGLKLSEIQGRIDTDFGIRMTYMDVRFLVDDLKAMPKDPEPPAPKAPSLLDPAKPAPTPPEAPLVEDPLDAAEEPEMIPPAAPGATSVSVSVDAIPTPGTGLSGKVTFSDGQSGQWFVNDMGQLGLSMKQRGYRPSPADAQAFQTALQRELRKMGMM